MPNRILKESIRTSKRINSLSDFQFRLWAYLITYVDDYGRGSADPELIKGYVLPRRKRVTESDIRNALAELAGMGCISLYEVDGESYFYFPNWGNHQRIQTKKSKYPAPEENEKENQFTDVHGGSPCVTVSHRDSRTESESESEYKSESNPNTNTNPNVCAEPDNADSAPQATCISLPLNDKTFFNVTEDQVQHWQELYTAVDVMQELRKMLGWIEANPDKKKTKRGILRFVTGWLAREQDRGRSTHNCRRPAGTREAEIDTNNPFLKKLMEGGYVGDEE